MFDDIVLLDDRMVAEGKDAGREDGRARGFKEGEGMGRGKGFQTAAEMSFCRGCCLGWLSMHAQDPDKFPFSEKALASMRAVVTLAESVPRVNTQEATAAQTAQRVRARFRAVTSMVGLPVVFDSKGQAEAKDFSF
ncbi:unnamed protein product [Ectocarpus sp. 12 AP-2014]